MTSSEKEKISGILRADLHMHSVYSDGLLTPEELVEKAKSNGVEMIALTDHDVTEGCGPMRQAADKAGLQCVTGVEISTDFASEPVHIVGLNIDPQNSALQTLLEKIRLSRVKRAERMADNFAKAGIPGAWEGVLKEVTNPSLIARPHFASWLVKKGLVRDIDEAFKKWLSSGRPGFAPRTPFSVTEAVEAVKSAGGVAVLAHPGRYKLEGWQFDELLKQFMEAGGVGIEVTTGSHRPGQAEIFSDLAVRMNLWASTGSDFHRPGNRCEPGLQGDLDRRLRKVWELF